MASSSTSQVVEQLEENSSSAPIKEEPAKVHAVEATQPAQPELRAKQTKKAAEPATPPEELHEIKVKVPVDQVLKLHYLRMVDKRTFSDVVGTALQAYLEDLLGEGDVDPGPAALFRRAANQQS